MRIRRTTITALGVLMAAGLALTACSPQSAPESDSSAPSGDTAAIVALADEKVAEYTSADQTFPVPTEAFDPGTGSASVIVQGSASAVGQLNAERVVDAFDAIGWSSVGPLDGEFSAPVTGGFIDAAVQDGRDAIVLVSVTLADVAQSVNTALNADIAIACIMCSYDADLADAGVLYSTIDFEKQGEILGWYFIQASGGTGKIASVKDPAVGATTLRAEGVTTVITENCSTCTLLDDIVIPSSDIALPGPPQWSAYLSSNPAGSVDFVNSMADVVGIPMAKTLVSIGRDDVKIGGFDADAEAIEMIRAGDTPFVGTVALPYYWSSWAAVDLVARQVAGVPTWDASNLPLQLVTLETVSSFDEFVPEGDWQGAFTSLWGKS